MLVAMRLYAIGPIRVGPHLASAYVCRDVRYHASPHASKGDAMTSRPA